MNKKKALILFTSNSGNTKMVADTFARELTKMDWDYDYVHINNKTGQVSLKGYDLICVGTQIIGGMPSSALLRVFGNGNYGNVKHIGDLGEPDGTPDFSRGPEKLTKGIIFLTYTGTRRGPDEAAPAFEVIRMIMADHDIKLIGKFCCCGKTVHHGPVDTVAKELDITVDEASELVGAYRKDHNCPEAARLSQKLKNEIEMEDKMKAKMEKEGKPVFKHRSWHYDADHRPNTRDLQKAGIFLEEILEDYYLPTEEIATDSMYVCLS